MIQKAFKVQVESVEALQALFGDRIYPVALPPGAPTPALVYYVLPSRRAETQDGPAGWEAVNLQTICYSASYADAWEAAEALLDAFDGESGTWASGTDDEVVIGSCFCSVMGDSPVIRPDSAQGYFHGVSQQWEIQPNE